MNRYGRQAMTHWEAWLPQAWREIPVEKRAEFFTELGEQVQARIVELSAQLAGEDPPGESYMDKLGRLNMARLQAEELVVREEVLLPPEPGVDPSTEQTPDPQAGWSPLV